MELKNITELLDKTCYCHSLSELSWVLNCLPNKIYNPFGTSNVKCVYHDNNIVKDILQKAKTFLNTEAKFREGERVELAVTPEINEENSWGWMGSKHFLIKGAKATVKEIHYYNNTFSYSVVFDDESWIDGGIIHPRVDCKYLYSFNEKSLKSGKATCEFLRSSWNYFYHHIGD